MPSDPVIDLDRLLAPIEGEHPTGEELSIADSDSPYLKTKDMWDEARKLVKEQLDCERAGGIDSQGQAWRSIPLPDWDSIIDASTGILASRSKDFRIAAWLTEALLRRHHAAGLRDGLKLCLGFCEKYWDQIRPAPTDEDGHSVTAGPFSGLVSEATFPAVMDIPIVLGQKQGERAIRRYTARDYFRAKDLESNTNPDERAHLMELGHVEVIEIQAIASVTEPEFFSNGIDDLSECIELTKSLGEFLRANCRDDQYDEPTYPGVTPFREQLESVRKLLNEQRGEEEVPEEEAGMGDGGGSSGGAREGMSRETAFQGIERIAQFFERTEPHTPVHFALRQAIRWGRMSLPELLGELIEDHNSMEQLRKIVGLPARKEEGQS